MNENQKQFFRYLLSQVSELHDTATKLHNLTQRLEAVNKLHDLAQRLEAEIRDEADAQGIIIKEIED